MRTVLLFLAVMAMTSPALAQADIAGEWGRDNHEDNPHRGPGAELGDFTGLPINAAARQKADTWDASILSQPERQAQPHPAQYSMRGPGPNVRIQKIVDPVSARLIAYTVAGMFGRADRVIWMDGRPHPSEYAEHTWGGFSTGVWEDGKLKVTTTHMKYGVIQRNGVPSSPYGTMTEWWIRHNDRLVLMTYIDDPIFLEEPFMRTSDFVWNPGQNVGPANMFETVDELGDKPRGWVPHWPLGTRQTEFAEHWNLPFDATRGGAESVYPEYMKKVQEMLRAMPAARPASPSSN